MALTMNEDQNHMWKRIGFARYAPEYWLVSQLTLNRLHGLEIERTTSDPKEAEYDSASMVRLERLITAFQGTNLL